MCSYNKYKYDNKTSDNRIWTFEELQIVYHLIKWNKLWAKDFK